MIPESSMAESSLPSLGTVFRRQSGLILSVFVIAFIAVIAITLTLPKRYESTMKVLVKKERADLYVTPGHTSDQTPAPDVSEADLNSEVELLRSGDILRPVVLQCGLEKREITGVQAAGPSAPEAEEKALKRLQKELSVSPVRKSNIIQISYLDRDPATAASVLRELASRYLDAHLSLHGAPGSYDFFRDQSARHQNELNGAEAALESYSKRNGLFVIDEQKDLLLRQITEAQTSLATLEAQIRGDNDRIAQVRQNLKGVTPRIVTQSKVLPNQTSVERLHTMLAELRNRRTDALTKFRSDDRMVVDLDQQIADTQTAMDRAGKIQAVEQATDVNPLTQELESDLAKADADRATAKAKAESLQISLSGYRARLAGITGSTNAYDALQRKVTESKQTYLLYKQKEEEARIAGLLDSQKIANVAIAETPRESILPASPNVKMDILMGGVFAAFLSVMTGWSVQTWFAKGEEVNV